MFSIETIDAIKEFKNSFDEMMDLIIKDLDQNTDDSDEFIENTPNQENLSSVILKHMIRSKDSHM